MTEQVRPEEAAQALTQIRDHQAQVVNVTAIPAWYWSLVGALMVALSAAVETRRPTVIGIAVPVFVLGILAGTGWVVRGALRVQPRNDLLGPRGVLLILGFVGVVVGLTLAVAFTLRASGVAHPATICTALAALLLAAGGPFLTRALRRIMLRNRDGAGR